MCLYIFMQKTQIANIGVIKMLIIIAILVIVLVSFPIYGFQIEDGTGSGRLLGITEENQIKTRAETHSLQHHISRSTKQAYQALSIDTGITAKTQTLLHLKNTDATRLLVISFIRFQAITSTASKPVVGEYFELGFGRTVSSGGTTTIPVNLNKTSGNVASVTATGIDPTMAGSFVAFDRIYHKASGEEYVFNKQGSIILGLNNTVEVRFVAAGTGEAKCRITFFMMANNIP